MSEKRFTVEPTMVRECIVDNATGEQLDTFDYTERLCDLLNEQQATIESKDKQLERLYNYFQYYLKEEMSSNAFSEMWDFVKEDEDWEDE